MGDIFSSAALGARAMEHDVVPRAEPAPGIMQVIGVDEIEKMCVEHPNASWYIDYSLHYAVPFAITVNAAQMARALRQPLYNFPPSVATFIILNRDAPASITYYWKPQRSNFPLWT